MSKHLNRFLIVDRAEEPSRLFSRIGRRLGYGTETATSLEAFRSALEKQDPTVVLIDIQSVDNNGLDHLKAIQRCGCSAQLILTSDSNTRPLETAKQVAELLGLSAVASLRSSIIVNVVRNELRKARQFETELTPGDLRVALDAGRIRPRYQAKAARHVRRGWPVAEAEALPCWHLEGDGIVLPADFFPIAEDAGLLPDITNALLAQLVWQLQQWRTRRVRLSAAASLPAPLLSDRGLPDRLAGLMREAKVEPGRLTLGISEALAMSYGTAAIEVISGLKAAGFRLAIDEFGTSYSSLEQLYRLKFDELKIDPSLVLESRISGDARTILEATIALAQKLGMSVCADGVDSQRTLQYLGRIGCDKALGNYIGGPVSAEALEKPLGEWNLTAVAS